MLKQIEPWLIMSLRRHAHIRSSSEAPVSLLYGGSSECDNVQQPQCSSSRERGGLREDNILLIKDSRIFFVIVGSQHKRAPSHLFVHL